MIKNKGKRFDKVIRQGSRITYMYCRKYEQHFIDSYNFFMSPLKKLSETYDIDTLKGYFPHHFNTVENQDYIGKLPCPKMFGAERMMPQDYKDFMSWYETFKGQDDWDFKEELVKYCKDDVELLAKAVLAFRKIFYNKLKTDPFRYKTFASLCMEVYVNKFMPKDTIVGNANSKQDSIKCREWLNHLNNENIRREYKLKHLKHNPDIDIHRGKRGKQVQYYDLKRPFTADGYDRKTNTVYQFHGCYWHGCEKCYPDNVIKHDKTMEQTNLLIGNGYKVEQCWECDWNEKKATLPNKTELETLARQQNINIRNALYGGRT
jgi:hypothetical protein